MQFEQMNDGYWMIKDGAVERTVGEGSRLEELLNEAAEYVERRNLV